MSFNPFPLLIFLFVVLVSNRTLFYWKIGIKVILTVGNTKCSMERYVNKRLRVFCLIMVGIHWWCSGLWMLTFKTCWYNMNKRSLIFCEFCGGSTGDLQYILQKLKKKLNVLYSSSPAAAAACAFFVASLQGKWIVFCLPFLLFWLDKLLLCIAWQENKHSNILFLTSF